MGDLDHDIGDRKVDFLIGSERIEIVAFHTVRGIPAHRAGLRHHSPGNDILVMRPGVGYEIDKNFHEMVLSKLPGIVSFSKSRIVQRLENHSEFVEGQYKKRGKFKYLNRWYKFPVMTRQEKELMINELKSVSQIGENSFEVIYSDEQHSEYIGDWNGYVISDQEKP